jgi:hypothetical protein
MPLPPASGDIARIAAQLSQPVAPQQPDAPPSQSSSGASPAKTSPHVPRWVWVAIVVGVGVGLGTGLVAANHQAGKISATGSTITVNPGTVTAGAP